MNEENFKWQMRFLPTIKNIVGPLLLEPATAELDMQEATDLLVIRARDMRIGCRVRRREGKNGVCYAKQYPWQFTLRSQTANGGTTELEKITNGWGDWLFYGHEHSETSKAILRWFVIDLASWRAHIMRRNISLGCNIPNGDGTRFQAFDLRDFPQHPPICVATSNPIPKRTGELEF